MKQINTLETSTHLLRVTLQDNHTLFTGDLTADLGEDYHRLLIPLKPGIARDKVEARLKIALHMNFYKVQLVGMAFIGRGQDEKVAVYLVNEETNGSQVRMARQAMMDLDAGARLSYPVKATI